MEEGWRGEREGRSKENGRGRKGEKESREEEKKEGREGGREEEGRKGLGWFSVFPVCQVLCPLFTISALFVEFFPHSNLPRQTLLTQHG